MGERWHTTKFSLPCIAIWWRVGCRTPSVCGYWQRCGLAQEPLTAMRWIIFESSFQGQKANAFSSGLESAACIKSGSSDCHHESGQLSLKSSAGSPHTNVNAAAPRWGFRVPSIGWIAIGRDLLCDPQSAPSTLPFTAP